MGLLTLIDKAKYFHQALEAGNELANASTWASRATLIEVLTTLLTAAVGLAKGFGYDLQMEGTDISAVALGIAAIGIPIANLLHVGSNPNAGMRRKARD